MKTRRTLWAIGALLVALGLSVPAPQAQADLPKQASFFSGLSTWGHMPVHSTYDEVVAHLDKTKNPYEARVFHKTGQRYLILESTSPMGATQLYDGPAQFEKKWEVTIYFRQEDDRLAELLIAGPPLADRAEAEALRDTFTGIFGPAHETQDLARKSVKSVSTWRRIWRNEHIVFSAAIQHVFRDGAHRWNLDFRCKPASLPKVQLPPGPSVPGEMINAPPDLPSEK
jgi:hypothetical protein